MTRRSSLYATTLGPREREALRVIEARPGMTISELAEAMGVGVERARQYATSLERPRVRREPD